jgi:hypothetical protein
MLFSLLPDRSHYPAPVSAVRSIPGGGFAEGLLDLLFSISEIVEDILGEAYGVLLGKVDPAVSEDRLKLLDGRIRHPDHRLRLPQSLLAFLVREAMAPLRPVLVFLEAVYEVPDTHGARLYRFGSVVPELHY